MTPTKKHIHGGNPQLEYERLAIIPKQTIDFSVNVNPLGPPPQIKKIWNSLYNEIRKYPSQNGDSIKNFYTSMFGINYGNVLAGNGSIELFYFVMQNLSLQKVLIPSPSFNDYSRATVLSGAKIISIPLTPKNNFAMPSIDLLNKKLKIANAVFIGHPNNPTGTMYSKDEIKFLSINNPTKWILLDEAFIQFVENYKEQSFLSENIPSNIILFHSLTKYYTLPGLRLGAVIANKKLISELENKKSLWSINRPAEVLVKHLLNCDSFLKKTNTFFSAERKRVYSEFSNLEGIKIFPSTANFFLAKWYATKELDDLQRELLKSGMYVRDARNLKHLSNNYFRFAILKKNENNALIAAIKKSLTKYYD